MLQVRKSQDRGFANHGWLRSFHSFSFAGYYDPQHMGWGNLRVINEDRVSAGAGFGTHGHKDMEIISYVLDGALAHKDSMGNIESIPAGDVQRMSAGTGVTHSEFNHSKQEGVHFLQIWIEPDRTGVAPGYEQKAFDAAGKRGRLQLVVSPDGAEGSLSVHADARMYAGLFDGAESAERTLAAGRKGYVHLVRGSLEVNGRALEAGDALLLADSGVEAELAMGRLLDCVVEKTGKTTTPEGAAGTRTIRP
ncbi:MAG: pirin family protein, partial [Comamonadaceae bacterium]